MHMYKINAISTYFTMFVLFKPMQLGILAVIKQQINY